MTCRSRLTLVRVELCGTAENMQLSSGILLVFLTLVYSDSRPGKGRKRLNLLTQHPISFLPFPGGLLTYPACTAGGQWAIRPEASLLRVVETSFQKQNICNKEGVLFHLVSFSVIGLRKHRGLGFYKPRPAVTSLSFDSLVLGRMPLFFLITEMKTELRKAS